MSLHEYAIVNHSRATVGRWIGVSAAFAAPIVVKLLAYTFSLPFMPDDFSRIAVSSGVIYFAFYWVFNRYGWRVLDKFLKTPNLSGVWLVDGKTINEAGEVTYAWKAKLTIIQNWDKIAIASKTETSGSDSETASIKLLPDGGTKLSYSYQNHPRVGEKELQKHQGFCELVFDQNLKIASGRYFNSSGRSTSGSMDLKKEIA